MIVPDDEETGFRKQPLRRLVLAIGDVLVAELGKVACLALQVTVNRIAEVEEKFRLLLADGVHDRERPVALPRVAAEGEANVGHLIGARGGDETIDRAGHFIRDHRSVVIGRAGLDLPQKYFTRVVVVTDDPDRRRFGGVLERRIFAVFYGNRAFPLSAQPDDSAVRAHVAGGAGQRQTGPYKRDLK